MIKKKNIYLLNFHYSKTPFVPVLWPSAKTYYEMNGKHTDHYNWVLPIAEFGKDLESIKREISRYPPDIFGVSLYVWNFELSLEVCKWVKETYPNCLVITGGPHQYFKYRSDWFDLHYFIDASLPSEVYGELTICDLLDHYAENDKIDWDRVEQMVYPGDDKIGWNQSPKSTHKRLFQWNYSAYETQSIHLYEYIQAYYKIHTIPLSWKLETTRGCPYSCTYCDWGGGIGGKTIFKDTKYVKQDIDFVTQHEQCFIYMCDANFGIGGKRDVEIIQYLADRKQETKHNISLYYGGLAKTNKHFDTIKKILEIEASCQLSYCYKISIQTFDNEILSSIKRTDLRKEEHWELEQFLRENYGYGSQIELIAGLPGMTLDKWCEEFNEPYDRDIQALVYEWHLLPESEAYDPNYRKKFGIKTSKKLMNDSSDWHFPAELVVTTNSYTAEDYKRMWIVYSIYILFYRGGIYKSSIKEIRKKHNLTFGQILRSFLDNVYPLLKQSNTKTYAQYEQHLNNLVDIEHVNDYLVTLTCDFTNHQNQELYLHTFFLMEYFTNFDIIDPVVRSWLNSFGINPKTIQKDSMIVLNEDRINTTQRDWFKLYRYNRYQNFNEFASEISDFVFYYPGVLLNSPSRLR